MKDFTDDGVIERRTEQAKSNDAKWRMTEEVGGHRWGFYRNDYFESCRNCGHIRRRDKKNQPCRGNVKIDLRRHQKLN